ncbi:MAG: response regulator [Cellvibrionaceae bacterium]|nr:response regulator [Cellvibrionaceae bacterium]
MKKLKISLMVSFAAMAMAPLVLMALLGSYLYLGAVEQEIKRSISTIADHKLERWYGFERSARQRLALVSRSSEVIDALLSYKKLNNDNENYPEQKALFEQRLNNVADGLKASGQFNALLVISAGGEFIYESSVGLMPGKNLNQAEFNNTSLEAVFNGAVANNQLQISPFKTEGARGQIYQYYIARPVYQSSTVIGVVLEVFDNREMNSIALDYTGLGETGETLFVSKRDGQALVVNSLRNVENSGFIKRIDLAGESGAAVASALAGGNGFAKTIDYRGKEVYAAWRYLPSINLAMVVKIDAAETRRALGKLSFLLLVLILATLLSVVLLAYLAGRRIMAPVERLASSARAIAAGDSQHKLPASYWAEFSELHEALNSMLNTMHSTIESVEQDLWFTDGINKISDSVSADQPSKVLARNIVRTLCTYLQAQAGALYLFAGQSVELLGEYGLGQSPELAEQIDAREGLLAEVIKDKQAIVVKPQPGKEVVIKIRSGIQESPVQSLLLAPVLYHGQVVAIIELAWLGEIPATAEKLLKLAGDSISLAIIAAEQRQQVQKMLESSQAQTEQLQLQQEELRVTNEELRKKGIQLRVQSDNLSIAKEETERKSLELEAASRYKSEFLANMSHELRTPLNSLLILARSLMENQEGNLNQDEVESAAVIHDSGRHLLSLINDILDISKIESGKMQLNAEALTLEDFCAGINSRFNHMAREKGIGFNVKLASSAPRQIRTDAPKLNQILTNLIGNAIKFTDSGSVVVEISRLDEAEPELVFAVEDSGIGIPKEQLKDVFKAFQQVDGSISRAYGGTGLGLSIASKLAQVLGGEIRVSSELKRGSRFALHLPLRVVQCDTPMPDAVAEAPAEAGANKPPAWQLEDDRHQLDPQKPLLLVIEDDVKFAKILMHTCHQQNCQVLVAGDGETGLALAEQYPLKGVVLDYMLPGLDGGDVISALKSNADTRDLPVHMITALDNLPDMELFGAVGKSTKPISDQDIKGVIAKLLENHSQDLKLLVVEDDNASFLALTRLLRSQGVELSRACNGEQAESLLHESSFDGVILDLGLPDTNGYDLLLRIQKQADIKLPPVVIYTGQDLAGEDLERLSRFTRKVVIKTEDSAERILEEVSGFVKHVYHSVEAPAATKPAPQAMSGRSITATRASATQSLQGRVVLLVDDDMRNTLSLAKVLRKKGLVVHIAPGGQEAIEMLQQQADIELVLMDIMMPKMDGYEATGLIRTLPQWEDIPVIALTANAMLGDREKCLAAGANDYMSKPVDVNKLLVLLAKYLPERVEPL